MSPINPNFKPGVGHLVTDRYDFQSHIDGTDFRQAAGTVDLKPPVLIGSTSITDVQTAIEALSGSIIVPSVPDATTVSKGIIQLNGDLFGNGTTALNPRVSGLQATPISVFSGLAANQVLTWNGSSWINQAVPGAISIAGDLAGVGSTLAVPRVGGLQGFSIDSATPTAGQGLVWNAGTSKWTPTGIPISPTGTGLASVTSGVFDAAATTNARYTGGKIQLSSNLQYISAGITGDLAWTPTASNKTLTLPNATDTLVALATVDTLTNKTINATNNTITDTSVATGDILAVIGGGKFTRLAKGANGSFLGVSAGTLGYFTPSSSTPAGTGFAHITGGVYDSNATANIRYAGAKFQTDVNIQYKTTGNLGDLAWGSLTTNRTLNLPDASDILVGQATADVLTNKTINATNNTITDTSTALGDLLKSNGTKFVRFAKGSALQVLRVNAGGTDLEFAAASGGASSSGATNTVQTSNGSGGFLGATDVLAGSGFISIGATPATVGTIRLPYAATDKILMAKDLGGTDREIISRLSANQYQIGPNTGNALSIQFTGGNLNFFPANQFNIQAPNGSSPSFTVAGIGQVTMNPNAFQGLRLDLNGSSNGPIALFFGGVTGVAAGSSNYIAIGNSTALPSGTPTSGGYLYSDAGALKWRGSGGTLTTIATADPHCKKCGRDFMHEWQNDQYGTLASCMPCLLDALQALGVDVDAFSDRNLA
jgi:hypothetical protein